MKVHKVYAKKDAIWPFTVVGRPPQEDTSFGQLIHEITGSELQREIPGLKELHAVDAAGVHPLLLAIGSERYTPYLPTRQPAELLTIANHILGTGQLSLAKFLFITAMDPQDTSMDKTLSCSDVEAYLEYFLQRIDLNRDIHFQTNTSIDTLDYSGTGLNTGSKVILAAYGEKRRKLSTGIPSCLTLLKDFENARLVLPGVVAIQTTAFMDYSRAVNEMEMLNEQCTQLIDQLSGTPVIVVCDDPEFVSERLGNFLWVTFTRCNPSHDLYGIGSFTENKHWGCKGPLVFDARIKPHHAPVLIPDPVIEKAIERIFNKGGSLYNLI